MSEAAGRRSCWRTTDTRRSWRRKSCGKSASSSSTSRGVAKYTALSARSAESVRLMMDRGNGLEEQPGVAGAGGDLREGDVETEPQPVEGVAEHEPREIRHLHPACLDAQDRHWSPVGLQGIDVEQVRAIEREGVAALRRERERRAETGVEPDGQAVLLRDGPDGRVAELGNAELRVVVEEAAPVEVQAAERRGHQHGQDGERRKRTCLRHGAVLLCSRNLLTIRTASSPPSRRWGAVFPSSRPRNASSRQA